MGEYLRRGWYMAAWADEVGERWLARRLLDEPVLIFRRTDGAAAAIGDRCPHRFAPLSLGKQVGDTVQCGYHGLRFDSAGRCVLNPVGEGRIPARAAVPSYPLVERHGALWVWMGEPALADPGAIPDFGLLTDPAYPRKTVGRDNYLHIKAGHRLVFDNLMDLSHAAFVHENTLASVHPDLTRAKLDAVRDGRGVESNLWAAGSPDPAGGPGLVDQWIDIRWEPPGALWLDIGHVAAGEAPLKRANGAAIHIVTPETEFTSHYFFGSARRGDGPAAAAGRAGEKGRLARFAFEFEDEPMLAAVQASMGKSDLMSLDPVILGGDAGGLLVRRTLDRLIAAENLPAEI